MVVLIYGVVEVFVLVVLEFECGVVLGFEVIFWNEGFG